MKLMRYLLLCSDTVNNVRRFPRAIIYNDLAAAHDFPFLCLILNKEKIVIVNFNLKTSFLISYSKVSKFMF